MAQDLLAEIKAVSKDFTDRFDSGNMTHLSKIYTEDCRFMPAGQDTIYGRDGVAEYFDKMFKAGITKLDVITDDVGPMGSTDVAYERVHFTFFKKDGSVHVNGKYVVVWKKLGGTWLAYIDIWNSNSS